MNNEQRKLDETIVNSYLSIGVAGFVSILGLIFWSQYFGWKVEWIFFRMAWMFFFICGIGVFVYDIYKLDGYTGTSVERNEIFFTFFDIPTIIDKDNLIINFTKKDLFLCVEKLSTAIAVLSISFIVFKFQPRFGLIYIINFISACLIPLVSSYFFFHAILKVTLCISLYLLKIKRFNYSNDAKDVTNEKDDAKDITNEKQKNNKFIEFVKAFFIIFGNALVICSLLYSIFEIAAMLTP